jgi:hypothetical protein
LTEEQMFAELREAGRALLVPINGWNYSDKLWLTVPSFAIALLQFFEVPFDKWRDIDLYALENAYLESGWDVARTAVVLMARLRVHRVRSM